MNPLLLVLDLDGTLTPPKSTVDPLMAEQLDRLLDWMPVAVISGAGWRQFRVQLTDHLRPTAPAQLHLLPTCGTRYLRWSAGRWRDVYAEQLAASDRRRIAAVLMAGAAELNLIPGAATGELIDDRGGQVTFSALGQQAPRAAKEAWDPDGVKKRRLAAWAAARLPDFDVRAGGTTSVDVTRRGIDKAHGIRRLAGELAVGLGELLYAGDEFGPGGNDRPVAELGVSCVPVRCWQDTAVLVERLIAVADG